MDDKLATPSNLEQPDIPDYAVSALQLFWDVSYCNSELPADTICTTIAVYQKICQQVEPHMADRIENVCISRESLALFHYSPLKRQYRGDRIQLQQEVDEILGRWPEGDRKSYVAVRVPGMGRVLSNANRLEGQN